MIRMFPGLLPLLGGCFMNTIAEPILATSTTEWRRLGPVLKPAADVFKTAWTTVVRQGFSIPHYDPKEERIDTGWDVHLSAHYREGYRAKLEVLFEKDESGATTLLMRAYREMNDNAKNPTSPDLAQWIGAGFDERQKSHMVDPLVRLHMSLKLTFFGVSND